MNETVAVIFIDTLGTHEAVIAYEAADISDYRDDASWLELGAVVYDTEKDEIICRY